MNVRGVKLPVAMILCAMAFVGIAVPAEKTDAVAAGYPAWTGLTENNRLSGRALEASDLRQRVTIVVEIDSAEAHEHLLVASPLAAHYNRLAISHGENWEHRNVHHDTIVLIVNRGAPMTRDKLAEAMQCKDQVETAKILQLKENNVSVYNAVTFPGAPDAGGQYPFYYVLGPEGLEPLAKGKAAGNGMQFTVKPAVEKGRAVLKESGDEWRPFYGLVAEPKFFKDLKPLIEKGKPLTAYETRLKKAIVSSDSEKAREAQRLYDGLVQTRSDTLMRIGLEAAACPHRAAYDSELLRKYWPGVKNSRGKKGGKGDPEVEVLSQAFIGVMEFSDPNFRCKSPSEAKKIGVELDKMKKKIEKLKESKNVVVQNGALLLDVELDALISALPSKVVAK